MRSLSPVRQSFMGCNPAKTRQAGKTPDSPPRRSLPPAIGGNSALSGMGRRATQRKKATGLKKNIFNDERQETSLMIMQWNCENTKIIDTKGGPQNINYQKKKLKRFAFKKLILS
ncbi:hypothetical protein PoB_003976700 [Plakobranchus ocellatus]|uniref:Uncharacterized protein n=1 Tax=Plakobranchus ocellatus TaxID=259542 RepID=A0AAV4B2D8_9GAST|nr:hypothetical protein PoB_003976700 [Plakobranchus ocellatus]